MSDAPELSLHRLRDSARNWRMSLDERGMPKATRSVLQDLRDVLGWTVDEAAHFCGVPKGILERIESGDLPDDLVERLDIAVVG